MNSFTSRLATISASALCGTIGITLLAAGTVNDSTLQDLGSTLSQTEIEARFHEIEVVLLISGYDTMEASRIAAVIVYGEDPDAPVGGNQSTALLTPMCCWIDVTVYYCDSSGRIKSKTLHVQRACWKTLVGTIGPMCPAPLCGSGQRPVLQFQLLAGCDADVASSCVLIENLSWQAMTASCDRAPPQMACSSCFPTSLCSTWACVNWSEAAPNGCPNCP
jgi:hypothetical protein